MEGGRFGAFEGVEGGSWGKWDIDSEVIPGVVRQKLVFLEKIERVTARGSLSLITLLSSPLVYGKCQLWFGLSLSTSLGLSSLSLFLSFTNSLSLSVCVSSLSVCLFLVLSRVLCWASVITVFSEHRSGPGLIIVSSYLSLSLSVSHPKNTLTTLLADIARPIAYHCYRIEGEGMGRLWRRKLYMEEVKRTMNASNWIFDSEKLIWIDWLNWTNLRFNSFIFSLFRTDSHLIQAFLSYLKLISVLCWYSSYVRFFTVGTS